MGRPIGSRNKQRAFSAALQVAVHGRPLCLRRIAERLLDGAEQGDLSYIRELADRLDGRPAQAIEYGDVPIRELTDAQLYEIASGGLDRDEGVPKALPAPTKPNRYPG
ncbi:hypothetical protein ACVI1J_005160 [Bradyrhizobium diazoefficiens]